MSTYKRQAWLGLTIICLTVNAQVGIHGDVQLAGNFTVGFLSPSLHFENGIVQDQGEAEATVYFKAIKTQNALHLFSK